MGIQSTSLTCVEREPEVVAIVPLQVFLPDTKLKKRNLVRFWDFFIVSYHFVNTHGTVEKQTRSKREYVVSKQASCIS